jgi:hypothetical protein
VCASRNPAADAQDRYSKLKDQVEREVHKEARGEKPTAEDEASLADRIASWDAKSAEQQTAYNEGTKDLE